ncbi:DUF3263 domain-containing protein [Cumulibacter soli]|uniref:DUF3263 domain-containing protein n=1 Tax=Cumulibacter soli TaxID=2546344 RepID=UPI001068391B|nr:DUF3263 domain-containing protein [Cumulibacter soli]
MNTLSERDRAILDFEARWWRYAGAKEQAASDELGVTGTRYYQLLNALIDQPAALAYAPTTVNRLGRQRVTRQRARSPRRLGLA